VPLGSYACRITVDRQTADILRDEFKLALVFNHETFDNFSDFTPVGDVRRRLSSRLPCCSVRPNVTVGARHVTDGIL
jgi:hypothetical protein